MKMKLVLSFSIIIVINICFGLYSLRSLHILNERVVEENTWTLGISELGDLRFAIMSLRRFDLNYVQQRDEDHKKNTLQRRADTIKTRKRR
ncbi:MAG: MCP four helix bundle domain-containing protein [Synergistaceae bacterium]|nr:MCP four helix bundle domain-containing protein [Synergistaceae bacterium]